MRSTRSLALAGTCLTLLVTGCGGSDDADSSRDRSPTPTSVAGTTSTLPAPSVTVPAPSTTTTDTTPTTTSTEPSGGTPAPTDPPTKPKPGNAGGEQPSISVDGDTARASASDRSVAELWCDQARAGAYDDVLADASRLVIAVPGAAARTCELPR